MYIAVKLDSQRNIIEAIAGTFNTHRECLMAARRKFGKAGGLQFVSSRSVLQ